MDYHFFGEPAREQSEIIEPGWQKRIRDALNREGTARQEIQEFAHLIRQEKQYHHGVLVMQGTMRDAILVATAADHIIAPPGTHPPLHRHLAIGTQSVDHAITLAYGLSAAASPDDPIGAYVGYATGQGEQMKKETRIGVSATGNMVRHVLEGRMHKENVGAIIVDGAEQNTVHNQLLISALHDLHNQEKAPLLIFLSRNAEKAHAIGRFFKVSALEQTFFDQRTMGQLTQPKQVMYEDAREPHHIKQSDRVIELVLASLEAEHYFRKTKEIVFLRDEEMLKQVLREVQRHTSRSYTYDEKKGTLETPTHLIQVIAPQVPLDARLRHQFATRSASTATREKSIILLTTQPADMVGIVAQFDTVIDTARDSGRGGYYSIPPEEAQRRASFAKPEGTCYRLTTEQEAAEFNYRDPDVDTYALNATGEQEWNRQLQAAGKDPSTFPSLGERWFRSREAAPAARAEQPKQQFDVPEHVMKLIQAFEQRGQRDVGLAIAACIRESRVFQGSSSVLTKAVSYFKTHSDLLIRLRALGEYISFSDPERQHKLENIGVNPHSMDHIIAMVKRWSKHTNMDRLSDELLGLDYETLTQILIETIPEQLAYRDYTAWGYQERNIQFADSTAQARANYGMQFGKECMPNILYHPMSEYDERFDGSPIRYTPSPDVQAYSSLFIVLTTAGTDGQFMTTAHPITDEAALRFMPDRVKQERGQLIRTPDSLQLPVKLLVKAQRASIGGGEPEEHWEVANEQFEKATEQEEQAFLEAEQKSRTDREEVQRQIATEVPLYLAVLEHVHTVTKEHRTAVEARIAALQAAQHAVEGKKFDPAEVRSAFEGQRTKLPLLMKKIATELKWPAQWFERFQEHLHSIPKAIAEHDFAQEVISEGQATAEQIAQELRTSLQGEVFVALTKGNEVDMNSMIDAVLEKIVA